MIKKRSLLFISATVCAILLCMISCGKSDSKKTEATPQNKETVSTEDVYVFPEDGILSTLQNGKATAHPDGCNPYLTSDKVSVLFDFATKKAGLQLSDATTITYTLKRKGTTDHTATAMLNSSDSAIKNEYGYIGVAFSTGVNLDRFETARLSLSFRDINNKEYFVNDLIITNGLNAMGLYQSAFDAYFNKTVKTAVNKDFIIQTGKFNGTNFTFKITLDKWSGKTTFDQITTLSRLFWQCYPRMHARFGQVGNSPTEVTLDIEDDGYEIAWASDNLVHLHDGWLKQNPNDYDCITHELAHIIQNGWDGDHCEYSGYIERFADCCRYLYAFNNGQYNDLNWEMQTVYTESTREDSVRFLAWLDYNFSTKDNDILLKFYTVCYEQKYAANEWDKAWAEILSGTRYADTNINEVFSVYSQTEFAKLSSKGEPGKSPLLQKYPLRSHTNQQ